jgi:hypothetical protein
MTPDEPYDPRQTRRFFLASEYLHTARPRIAGEISSRLNRVHMARIVHRGLDKSPMRMLTRRHMKPARLMTIALMCGAAAVASPACNRSGKKTTAVEMQAQTPVQQPNQPVTVTGCVKAGEAANTFVLTAARTAGSDQTATYQLRGPQANQLKDQVGHRVEVNGVLTMQQQTESLSTTETDKKAKGTTGTPTVSTQTDVDLRQLDVHSVKPLNDRCEM